MRQTFTPILVVLFVLCTKFLFGQDNIASPNDFNLHKEKAQELNLINLFAESINELNIAIEIAERNKNEEQLIDATISLGELMRRTQRYTEALEILSTIENCEKYPLLYVRRLGRMAAIYAENGLKFEETSKTKLNVKDSIASYINRALEVAVKNKFSLEEASLRNELGLFIMRHGNPKNAISHLIRSGSIYWKSKDTLGYIVTMVNVLEYYKSFEQYKEFDQLSSKLIKLSKGKKWYTAEARVFKHIGNRYLQVGDSLRFYKWQQKAGENFVSYFKEASSQQMASFQALFETEKFQKRAVESNLKTSQKEKELEEESSKSKNLVYSLLAMIVVLGFVGLILFRERKLKNQVNQINEDLNISNEKYQLLMIESNHRIKNNLQMVISMLEYASDDVRETGSVALKRISSKIHTISSLHKHLYSDVHNELVDISVYFNEIINSYTVITSGRINTQKEIEPIRIQSERIVYFGLVFNELLANTIEHNTSDEFNVGIEITQIENGYFFEYSDSSRHDEESAVGTGSLLITQLITRIGGKKLEIDKLTGTYKFTFDA